MADGHDEPRLSCIVPCPNCGKAMKAEFRPFCSARCKDVDLARWLTGSYAIAGHEDDEEDGSGHMEKET